MEFILSLLTKNKSLAVNNDLEITLIGFLVVQGHSGHLWLLLGFSRSKNMFTPYSFITFDRHQCCNVDRQSFISSTASSREADLPLFSKTGITLDRQNWKDNSIFYLVSKYGLYLTVGRSPSIDRNLTRLCSSAPQKAPKSPYFSRNYLNL